jgi:hypothetical protein
VVSAGYCRSVPRFRRVSVIVIVVGGMSIWAPPADAGAPCGWTDATPSSFSSASAPIAVDATSSTNAWIVGVRGSATSWRARSWLWNGSTFSSVPVPSLPTGSQTLGAVDAVAIDDAWAVGASSTPGPAMIVHWNGLKWRHSPGPRFTDGAGLRGVVETGPNQAWAVGSVNGDGLMLRWNGTRWHRVRLSFDPDRSPSFSSIAAASRRDVWAVGTIRQRGSTQALGITNPVAMHWDGSWWTRVHLPHRGAVPESLASVTARASDDAWAVGTTADENAPTNPGLVYHWNGASWSRVPHPFVGSGQNDLTGVTAPAADAAWIVGEDAGGTGQPFALVWDGSTWTTETLPAVPGDLEAMSGVVVLPSNDGWATGSFWSSSPGGDSGPWVLRRTC